MRLRQWSWWKTERPVRYLVGCLGEGAVRKGRREACRGVMRDVAYSVYRGGGLVFVRVVGRREEVKEATDLR